MRVALGQVFAVLGRHVVLDCVGRKFEQVEGIGLGEDVGTVYFDGAVADCEAAGNILVAQALQRKIEHLLFAPGQAAEPLAALVFGTSRS